MAKSRIYGEQIYLDNVQFMDLTLPTGTSAAVSNANVASNAAIDADKLVHQHKIVYAQANTSAADETRIVYECHGTTGTIEAVTAGSIAKAVGDSTVTVDVKKNGTTVLSGVVTLDSGNTNRVSEAGTLSVTDLADGDVLEIVIDATVGTGTLPTGVWVAIVVNEQPI